MKKFAWLLAAASLSLPLAVSAQDATPEVTPAPAMAAIELPAVDPLMVDGDIITAGSSTVFPLAEAVAELFVEEGYGGNITIDSIGSGAGIERFCVSGETDIANASRAIKEDEIAQCAEIGRSVIEFRVGTDALTVVVSSANDFVTDLSEEQLFQIFSGAATTWADVDPSFPAQPIQLFSPGSDSGTFDYFVEVVFEGAGGLEGDQAAAALLNARNIQLSEDDNVLVQGVEGSPYAIGYFGYAYYLENANLLNAVSVNGITPTEETAENNTYPLSRPLYLYSAAEILAENPAVADYISYFLSNVNNVIIEAGYFPASVEALNEGKAHYLTAVGMADQIPAEVQALLDAEAAE